MFLPAEEGRKAGVVCWRKTEQTQLLEHGGCLQRPAVGKDNWGIR